MKPSVGGVFVLSLIPILIILGIITNALPVQALSAQGCTILSQQGPLPDSDCDGVPNQFDNCPYVNNADQSDMNRNAVGDVCDMLIQDIVILPDNHLHQGDFAHLTVRLLNNHNLPLRNIEINVRNNALGIDADQLITFVPSGETAATDFWLKIPKCAKAQSYQLSITATYENPATGRTSSETENQIIYVEKGTVCGTTEGALDNTIINVMTELDTAPGGSLLIPVTITNLGDNQATYNMHLADLGNFGTWRIDPAPRMILSAGHRDAASLFVQTESHVPPGEHTLQLTVVSGEQKTIIPLKVYVRSTVAVVTGLPPFVLVLQIFLVIALICLIAVAIVIAIKHGRNRKDSAGSHGSHKVEPYYENDSAEKYIPERKSSSAQSERTTKKSNPKRTLSVETEIEKKRMETHY